MNEQSEAAKKAALLMIPYGLYVLGAKHGADYAVGTINWVTQTSFKPPLVAMGVKQDSGLYSVLKASGSFALSTSLVPKSRPLLISLPIKPSKT